jgi:hypothetical protein
MTAITSRGTASSQHATLKIAMEALWKNHINSIIKHRRPINISSRSTIKKRRIRQTMKNPKKRRKKYKVDKLINNLSKVIFLY